MSSNTRLVAVALAALMVLSVVGPGVAMAQTQDDSGNLSVDVTQDGDNVVVTVMDEDGPVEGANVTVTQGDTVDDSEDENETETEDNETETEDNETETETEDNETETQTDTATATEDASLQSDNETETETSDSDNETETDSENETEDENYNYEGTGTYTTGPNGTVELPAPEQGVRLTITAEDGNESTTVSVTLTGSEEATVPFGQRVSMFVQQLVKGDNTTNIGQQVSEFVREHNPGNAPASAGPPEHAGPDGERGPPENKTRGPPENKGADNKTQGPPENKTQGPPEDGDKERGGPDKEERGNGGNGGNGGADN